MNKLQKVGIGGIKGSSCCSKCLPIDIQYSGSRPVMLRLEILLKVFLRRITTNPVVIKAFNCCARYQQLTSSHWQQRRGEAWVHGLPAGSRWSHRYRLPRPCAVIHPGLKPGMNLPYLPVTMLLCAIQAHCVFENTYYPLLVDATTWVAAMGSPKYPKKSWTWTWIRMA